MNYKKKKGQILLITLFILSIMAILLALTIRIVLVDTQQSDSNQDFTTFYNVSENITQDYVAGATDTTLDEIQNSCAGTATKPTFFTVECDFKINQNTLEKNSSDTTNNVNTNVVVKDESIVEIDLKKDQAFSVELTAPRDDNSGFISFNGEIYVEWPGNDPIAVEIILTYFTDITSPNTTDSVWDEAEEDLKTVYAVFNHQMLNVNPTNPVTIRSASNNTRTYFRFSIKNAIESMSTDPRTVPKSMVIIPRMNDASRQFTIRSNRAKDHDTNSIYPIQMREITTTTFDSNDPESPIAEVTTIVPKYPQLDTLFYYVLLSQEPVVIP